MDKKQIQALNKIGYGMSIKHSTYEDRCALVKLFKEYDLKMSNGVSIDFQESLEHFSLVVTKYDELYFTLSEQALHIHMSLRQWKTFFGLKEHIDNSSEATNTWLDSQIKQVIDKTYENTEI